MHKLKILVLVVSGALLVACSPRVNQPPPLSELDPPTDGFLEQGIDGDYTGDVLPGDASGAAGPDWGPYEGNQGLTQRPGTGEWASDYNLKTILFSYNKYDLSEEARRDLLSNAEYLRANAGLRILVEGHCDERGTEEYNMALGENRALAVREYLIQLGVSPTRVDIISYGEQRPIEPLRSEAAFSRNRRAEFKVAG